MNYMCDDIIDNIVKGFVLYILYFVLWYIFDFFSNLLFYECSVF